MGRKAGIDTVQQSFLDHQFRALSVFLGKLETQTNRSVDFILHILENLRAAEQHRAVAVVSAGVHDARLCGGVVKIVFLLYRQRVHIRAQQNAFTRLFTADGGNGAVVRHCDKWNAHFGQFFADLLRGILLLQTQLRILVEISSHFNRIISVFSRCFCNVHLLVPLFYLYSSCFAMRLRMPHIESFDFVMRAFDLTRSCSGNRQSPVRTVLRCALRCSHQYRIFHCGCHNNVPRRGCP